MLRFLLGLLLVLAGGLILFTNLGLVDPAAAELVLQALVRLWPALLVVWGISLIFHRQPRLARLLSLAALLAGLALALSLQRGPVPVAGNLSQPLRVALPDQGPPVAARLYLRGGGGRVELAAGSGDLVHGALRGLARPVHVASYAQGEDLEVELVQPLPSPLAGLLWPGAATASWQVGLHPALPWDLDLDLVSALLELDARRLPVRELRLSGTSSRLRVSLPATGAYPEPPAAPVRLRFRLRSSRLELGVPAGAGLSLRVQGAGLQPGLSGEGLVRDGDRYVSPNYPEASIRYRIDLDLSLSTFHLLWEEEEPSPSPRPEPGEAPADGLPDLSPDGAVLAEASPAV
ncbi:hypothetical protein [Limnochorda pilosa]|uniref:hypothetical protein n=1 Tax=Limnochorda pilosa TaxID=1555112 RepID=UPI0011875D40|nr:hypothetical protein [Limnochorda pilosa]